MGPVEAKCSQIETLNNRREGFEGGEVRRFGGTQAIYMHSARLIDNAHCRH